MKLRSSQYEQIQIHLLIKSSSYILAIILVFIIGYFYFRFDPSKEVFFLKCPFHTITGLDCPACGMQRATHELLHFNFATAWRYNPLLILAVPYALMVFIFGFTPLKKFFPQARKLFLGRWAVYIILGIILIFWIVRNL